MRCTRAEMTICHVYTVHFVGDPEPTRKPVLSYPQCESIDTRVEHRDGFTFHHCPKHARKP